MKEIVEVAVGLPDFKQLHMGGGEKVEGICPIRSEQRGIRFLLGERLLEFQLFSWGGFFSSYLHEKAISIGDPKAMSCIQ